jgi:hypothetical protein
MSREDDESRRRDQENQRTMKFILAQQAQCTADMHQLCEAQVAQAAAHAEAQARTDKQMAETDERLNALVNVVERLIGARRNGGGAGETRQ